MKRVKKEKYEYQTFDELVDKVPLALSFIPVLKLLAIRGETMTYKELGQLFNLHYRAVPSYLRILDIYCQTHRLPHLNHLVVHQLSQVSGGANFTDAPTNFHDQWKTKKRFIIMIGCLPECLIKQRYIRMWQKWQFNVIICII